MLNSRVLVSFALFCTTGQAFQFNFNNKYTIPSCIDPPESFGFSEPEDQGVDLAKLLALTEWVRNNKIPILSLTISKNGKVVYELYTSKLKREESHYLMSVTKSVTSALVGAALDRGLFKGTDQKISEILPRSVFPNELSFETFKKVTVKEVMGMSALDAPVSPHVNSPEAVKRIEDFMTAKNRVSFALSQQILAKHGKEFQYTDVTPAIAAGLVEYTSGKSMLDFGNETLFGPMGFENQDWMHEDPSGIDNASFGIRLRPIDMQKFGILFMNVGCWKGKQLLSKNWVRLSFTPWIRNDKLPFGPNYGWYWWLYDWGSNIKANTASGWKGQRIAVFPDKKIVFTMTALIHDGSEDKIFAEIAQHYIAELLQTRTVANHDLKHFKALLKQALEKANTDPSRISSSEEYRMIPEIKPKEKHHRF